MEDYLTQLQDFSFKHNTDIAYTGDIFHKWNSSAELINFAIDNLPMGHAIPGQHDLPLHNYEDIKKSAYWTLKQAHALIDIKGGQSYLSDGIVLHGFPWGFDPVLQRHQDNKIHVALVHKYIWRTSACYPGAPEESHAKNFSKVFKSYNAVFIGDNHKSWEYNSVMNCGGFYRSKRDEKDHQPRVGILFDDGTVGCHFLDCKKDKWEEDLVCVARQSPELEHLIEMLDDAEDIDTDFTEVVKNTLNRLKVSKDVRSIVLDCLERKSK